MTAEALISILDGIEIQHGYSATSLKIDGNTLPDLAALETLMSRPKWQSAVGWIARQSGVVIRPGEADDPSLGDLVEAELGTHNGSLQIRRHSGRWCWTELAEEDGASHLCDDIVLVTTAGKAARYRRYWITPEDGEAEIVACRLVQFEELI